MANLSSFGNDYLPAVTLVDESQEFTITDERGERVQFAACLDEIADQDRSNLSKEVPALLSTLDSVVRACHDVEEKDELVVSTALMVTLANEGFGPLVDQLDTFMNRSRGM